MLTHFTAMQETSSGVVDVASEIGDIEMEGARVSGSIELLSEYG